MGNFQSFIINLEKPLYTLTYLNVYNLISGGIILLECDKPQGFKPETLKWKVTIPKYKYYYSKIQK